MKAKVIGRERLSRALVDRARSYERAAGQGLKAWAALVRNHAVRSVQKGPKSGAVYARGTVSHQASAPGEAPATDTGVLAGSIGWNVEASRLVAEVFAGAAYAIHLELGTRHMAPRPFLAPALEATKDRGLAVFKAALARAS